MGSTIDWRPETSVLEVKWRQRFEKVQELEVDGFFFAKNIYKA